VIDVPKGLIEEAHRYIDEDAGDGCGSEAGEDGVD
jgi:hypothetical protein